MQHAALLPVRASAARRAVPGGGAYGDHGLSRRQRPARRRARNGGGYPDVRSTHPCPSPHPRAGDRRGVPARRHIPAAAQARDRALPQALEQEVFALLLAESKISEEIVANIRSWKHSGFSVDQSVRLEAGDQEGVQRLIQYFLRCPFSQARMIEVTEAGKVISLDTPSRNSATSGRPLSPLGRAPPRSAARSTRGRTPTRLLDYPPDAPTGNRPTRGTRL
ncbi:MAG TPA: transposase [Verrucomicrobiota bacterium]|nr:transposase [Verrucomicrobiota bacterium]HRZ54622.1 transposase [Candidatus Paceibacterota bacterium]